MPFQGVSVTGREGLLLRSAPGRLGLHLLLRLRGGDEPARTAVLARGPEDLLPGACRLAALLKSTPGTPWPPEIRSISGIFRKLFGQPLSNP